MFEKITALFDNGKLPNYIWFFGCMVLGIAAITGMACAYCGLKSRKQKCCTSGESDAGAAKKGPEK